MQDRYAGDVGDFVKLGLVRHLTAALDLGGAGLSVGLNWYLAPNEAHNADGKHITYLNPANRQHLSLASCDPELIERLADAVATGRSVAILEASGVLPPGCPTHGEMLVPWKGLQGRRAWHRQALNAVARAEVVFADPDNGICSLLSMPKLHKYALISELADYARRGQSLVVYQHADRSADARTQARRRLDELAAGVGQEAVGAVIAHRGTCRFFLITATDDHRERLEAALRRFVARWTPHAELVNPARV